MSWGNPAGDARIITEGLSYTLPTGRVLLQNLDLAFGRERTGLIGPNGSGKTTLLMLLDGGLAPSSGFVRRTGTVAMLAQDFRPTGRTPLSTVLGIDERLSALRRLESGRGDLTDLERVGDDWELEARVRAEMARFGLGHLQLDRPVGALSGGQATRVALAGMALTTPDFLLLDEPTNHLDRSGRVMLLDFVETWRGGLLAVSHDRELLRRMERIVEITGTAARVYGGNYDDYRARRAEDDAAAERELASARSALKRAEGKARGVLERQAHREARGRRQRSEGGLPKILLNARKAQAEGTGARIRAVTGREVDERKERAAEARRRVEEREPPRFHLPRVDLPKKRIVLEMGGVTVRFPVAPRPLLEGFSMRIEGPERVAVVGPNGCGKTTLLQVAVGRRRPDAGIVRRLPNSQVAWLDQRGLALDPERSVADNLRLFHPALPETELRHTLARFLFPGGAALQAAGTLSGGQWLRASLACILGGRRPPSLLVLDEPTNHLDFDALESLEEALRAYTGALLVASHDESFLDAIGIDRHVELPTP